MYVVLHIHPSELFYNDRNADILSEQVNGQFQMSCSREPLDNILQQNMCLAMFLESWRNRKPVDCILHFRPVEAGPLGQRRHCLTNLSLTSPRLLSYIQFRRVVISAIFLLHLNVSLGELSNEENGGKTRISWLSLALAQPTPGFFAFHPSHHCSKIYTGMGTPIYICCRI